MSPLVKSSSLFKDNKLKLCNIFFIPPHEILYTVYKSKQMSHNINGHKNGNFKNSVNLARVNNMLPDRRIESKVSFTNKRGTILQSRVEKCGEQRVY